MNEAAAAQVLLLRAYESTGFTQWSDADRRWASRAALQSAGAAASADHFLAARAQLGLQKLAPHDPWLGRWRALRAHRPAWLLGIIALGLLLGLLVDRIGSSQRINLLAPPVWALIAWNLAVYVALLVQGLARPEAGGSLRRGLVRWLQRWRSRRLIARAGDSTNVWRAFAAEWGQTSLPLSTARIALALHLGAAALALGLIGGMYLRGLVLDYRVGWESTFLDAGTAHAALSALLSPATALSGIALPDAAGMQALQLEPGQLPGSAASAAPWIHLYALQLSLLVVLPRLALALGALWRVRQLQAHLALPLHEPYFKRLLGTQRGDHQAVRVWPHVHAPDAIAQAALGAVFARVYGDDVQLLIEPAVAYGAEDELPTATSAGGLQVALFDLGATPEADSQGRLVRSLSPDGAAPALMLVDESAFAQRFGAGSPRLPARRKAWADLAGALGCAVAFVNLRDADAAAAEAALQEALMQPAATT